MWTFSQLTQEEKLRVRFIIDMGVAWSGMMRVFVKGTRERLDEKILDDLAEKVFASINNNRKNIITQIKINF